MKEPAVRLDWVDRKTHFKFFYAKNIRTGVAAAYIAGTAIYGGARADYIHVERNYGGEGIDYSLARGINAFGDADYSNEGTTDDGGGSRTCMGEVMTLVRGAITAVRRAFPFGGRLITSV